MEVTQALRERAALTAARGGMVTPPQASTLGISRLQLTRLAEGGHLERVSHGIYRDPGSPPERFDTLKAAWISIDPRRTAQDRLSDRPRDAVVSGAAASHLLGIGDLVPEPYEFTVPKRRQTQRTELRYRVRELPSKGLTMREGLPVTTQEQTIADLVESRIDLSLVADVLSDTEALDSKRLAKLLSPLAQRNAGTERLFSTNSNASPIGTSPHSREQCREPRWPRRSRGSISMPSTLWHWPQSWRRPPARASPPPRPT